jgi:hypothetical protein
MDVGGWLRNLGLGQYESAFIKNAIAYGQKIETVENTVNYPFPA